MKLSTSTNLLFLRPDGKIYPPKKAVEKIVASGFRTLDFNFYDWVITKGSPYMEPDGDEWLISMKEQADQLGVRYEQSHATFFNFLDPAFDEATWESKQAEVVRSVRNAYILGSDVVVLHPASVYDGEGNLDLTASCEKNIEYYERLIKETSEWPIKIAIENMTDVDTAPKKKYCARPEELINLVDSIKSDRIGICWDFEHGYLMEQNQPEIVEKLGKRLLATHISDAHGFYPVYLTHRLPLTGKTEWAPIVQALVKSGYEGCFSFEAHNYMNTLPDRCIDSGLALAHDVGEHLMSLGENV